MTRRTGVPVLLPQIIEQRLALFEFFDVLAHGAFSVRKPSVGEGRQSFPGEDGGWEKILLRDATRGGFDPLGETQNQPFQLSFNPCLKVDFQGSRVTSDSGLLLVRELDERLGLSALIAKNIMDDRRGKNTQLPLPDLLRQSIYSRLAGYEDVNDAERLSQDPTFRLFGSEKIWERGAALPSRLHWFETEVLSQDENLEGLSQINRELLAKGGHGFPPAGGAGRTRH